MEYLVTSAVALFAALLALFSGFGLGTLLTPAFVFFFPVPVAVAATRRSKPAVNHAVRELVNAGVLTPVSRSQRNRAWEAVGLLDLIIQLEAGADWEPASTDPSRPSAR